MELKPYKISYKDYHTGDMKEIWRRVPEKLHDIESNDLVELTSSQGQWPRGAIYRVKDLARRQPNVLELEGSEHDEETGRLQTRFVNYNEVLVKSHYKDRLKDSFDYLRWP
jgi:hypothetical protein